MKTRHEFPRKVVEWPDMRITMPDGCVLSARIWLPEDATEKPVPAILEHLPYRKRDGTIARDELTHPYLAGHGYACIRVDMRGNGDSEGLMFDEYERQEWDDAISVMDWVRAQAWCSGTWGMMGISWGGFNALQVAALRPKGLGAIIPLCATTDRYADDIHWKGGCMLGENLGWAAQMLAYSARPPDPLVAGSRWREMWLERLQSQPFLLETWLAHQRRDDYWKHGSVCEDWDAINVPVLSIGGWHDGYRNTPAALSANLKTTIRTIVGPWIHKYPHFAGPEPRIGFLQEALRWWDHWLKGIDTGIEETAAQRLYLMDSVRPARWLDERPGRWIAVDGIVPCQIQHLGAHSLGAEPGTFETVIDSPQTCGDGTGEYFPFAFGPELPGDQTRDDAMSACFDGPAANDTRDIVGAPELTLRVIPSATSGQIAVRLCDLRPDGSSALITHGFLNLRHAASHKHPSDLSPGASIDVSVTLDQCAYRLPAGHRLRIAISTAYWPFVWPAPDAGGVTITKGALTLPVRPTAAGDETGFQEPEAGPAWKRTVLRDGKMTRTTDTDENGVRRIRVVTDDGAVRDDAHGLETDATCVEDWLIHPDDPLSAECRIVWECLMKRGDWQVRMRSEASLTASQTHWHPRAKLETWEGETPMFSRNFASDIPRDGI